MNLREEFFRAVLKKNLKETLSSEIGKMSMENFKIGYLDEYLSCFKRSVTIKDIESEINEILNDGFLPVKFKYLYCDSLKRMIRNVFGFSLATSGWLDEIAKLLKGKKVVEVMAGRGIISGYLQCKGINIIATDNNSWSLSNIANNNFLQYTSIENIDAVDAIKKYGKTADYIIMSWPPYESKTAYDVLIELRKLNPKAKIIYIGEGLGGCCANDNFFNTFKEIENDYIAKANRKIQTFCDFYEEWDCEMSYNNIYLVK